MQRLIDANELWGQIYKLSHNHKWKDRTNIAFNKCLDAIQFFPTVDAEPVRHGHWINDFSSPLKCSFCGIVSKANEFTLRTDFKFCPYCGAKMDAPTQKSVGNALEALDEVAEDAEID